MKTNARDFCRQKIIIYDVIFQWPQEFAVLSTHHWQLRPARISFCTDVCSLGVVKISKILGIRFLRKVTA